jgi:hypothetical protein
MRQFGQQLPLDESLLAVASHITALQVKLRSLADAHQENPVILPMIDDLRSRVSSLADATSDATSYLRDAHTLDPFLGVSRDDERMAICLIAAYLDALDQAEDYQILYDLIGELFTKSDTSYRALASVVAALARAGATLARQGNKLATQDALRVLRECLLEPAH